MKITMKKFITTTAATGLLVSFQPAMAQFVGGVAAPGSQVEAPPAESPIVIETPVPKIKEYQEDKPVWDISSSFGPVPKNLQKIGNAECKKAKYDRAVGYANTAQNPDGSNFEKGGFLCESDSKKSS